MRTRRLGRTELQVSEIGFGGEWLDKHPEEDGIKLIKYAASKGINIIDCWMADPKTRNIIGEGIKGNRENWYIQGHIGSAWVNEQYLRTRDMKYVKMGFEDLLTRLQTDYIDLGMIHYLDNEEEWDRLQDSDYMRYIWDLKEKGTIRNIGISTHNPRLGVKAATCGFVDMILFAINPAYDLLPATADAKLMFSSRYELELNGIDPERALLYKVCSENDVGITVMKCFSGGRLFDKNRSPFGVALTPVQCIHYALTRPAVGSVLCGYEAIEHIDAAIAYETASEEEKDFASVIAKAPLHSYKGQCTYCGHCKPCPKEIDIATVNKFYDLATMQDKVPASIKDHYLSLKHHASECINCKGCESRCPFEVKVSERMKKAAQLFGE